MLSFDLGLMTDHAAGQGCGCKKRSNSYKLIRDTNE